MGVDMEHTNFTSESKQHASDEVTTDVDNL